MGNLDINNLMTLILGGGLVGTIGALVSGYRSLREGARSRERGTIEDLVNQRKKAADERDQEAREKDFAFDQRDYWRNRSADLEFVLRKHGIDLPPRDEEPKREA